MFKENSPVLFAVDAQLIDWITRIRRHIHAYPELSFQEYETASFIEGKLRELAVPFTRGVAGTGIVADIGASEKPVAVALRADMDALPVNEETGLSFASRRPGSMHACGHDGHVAMLLGAAALLVRQQLPGRVRLLFQPAEEHGNGGERFVDAGVLEGIDEIYAGHIDTHYPLGTATIDEGIICAWADPFSVRIKGSSGHAARPHEAVDAVVAAANMVMSVQTLVSREVDPNRAAVITIGSMEAGTAQNIIAGTALLKGTIRSTHCQTRKSTIGGLKRIAEAIAGMYRVEVDLRFMGAIPAVSNEKRTVENARIASSRTPGLRGVVSQGAPSLGAEDFAFYQQKIPGCMVRFGSAPSHAAGVAHSSTFDFSEEVMALGASWYANVAWQALSRLADGDS